MHRKLLITVSLALLMASCAKERPEGPGDGKHSFRITPEIHSFIPSQNSAASSSRALVEGPTFASGNEAGYMVLGSAGSHHNANAPHLGGYGNVRALAVGNGQWMYYIYHNQYLGQSLSGFPSYGNVDIYGYHPYDADIDETDLHAIPYSLGTPVGDEVTTTGEMVEKDYMYATPVMNYAMQSGQSASVTFNHIMTCLEFRIRKLYSGPALTLSYIDFTINGAGNRKFSVSGEFDATTGTITSKETATSIRVNYDRTMADYSSSNIYMSCSLILPPLEYSGTGDDATITAEFHFVDQDEVDLEFREGTTYEFKLSEVNNQDSNPLQGLRAGRCYQVQVDVSNFVKYNGTPTIVSPDWDNETTNSEPTII